ncbi:MAG: hypothetical protein R3313_03145 [Candidatus Saccharimonadales bacterium]|nr:hypothetical protein [Candidatus Saccharimonadales bacterium]
MDPNSKPPIQPAPQNSIPNDTVDELPMNNNTFEDVTAPVTGIGNITQPGDTPPPPPPGSAPGGGPAVAGPQPPKTSGISSFRSKLPWGGNNAADTSKIASGQPSAFSAPEPVTSAAPSASNTFDNPQTAANEPATPAEPIQPVHSGPLPIIADGQQADLLDIKKDALKELSPLVEHIDQKPQERFKTLLDMIRASDDVTLVRPAYAAAQAIEDDKDRAQALLDVVKEVNYLTQTKGENPPPPPPLQSGDPLDMPSTSL